MVSNRGLSVPTYEGVEALRELAIEQPDFLLESSFETIKKSLPEWDEVELDVEVDLTRALSKPTEQIEMDSRNATIVRFEILPTLPLNLATDERLWVALTFGPFRDYVRARFPEEKRATKSPTNFLENYYFCGGRNFKRSNAIARLWWLGEISNFPDSDEKSLTGFLVKRQEIYSNVIDRSKLFTSPPVRWAVLLGTREFFEDSGLEWDKTLFRKVMVELDFLAGRKHLPAIPVEDLTQITKDLFERFRR